MQEFVRISGFRFQSMAECMTQIEERAASTALGLIISNDRGFRTHALFNGIAARVAFSGKQALSIALAPGEEIRIVDQAIFDNFGIACADFARG